MCRTEESHVWGTKMGMKLFILAPKTKQKPESASQLPPQSTSKIVQPPFCALLVDWRTRTFR